MHYTFVYSQDIEYHMRSVYIKVRSIPDIYKENVIALHSRFELCTLVVLHTISCNRECTAYRCMVLSQDTYSIAEPGWWLNVIN